MPKVIPLCDQHLKLTCGNVASFDTSCQSKLTFHYPYGFFHVVSWNREQLFPKRHMLLYENTEIIFQIWLLPKLVEKY